MAIWDDALSVAPSASAGVKTEYSGSGTKGVKCPGCAGNLRYEPLLGKLACRNCGSLYLPDSIEYTNHFGKLDYKEVNLEYEDKYEYLCDSCGAVVVTDKVTTATFCAHCGSPTLIKRRLTKDFSPEYIIPFKITKENALEKAKKWISNFKDKPKTFGKDLNINSITGIYVPFWLINAHVNTEYNPHGYGITKKKSFDVTGVPFDGSSHIDNQLMRAIEPYNYLELTPYSDNYLPGFFAERYDESPFGMFDIIEKRLENYGREYISLGSGAGSNSNSDFIFGYLENLECSYALLPVYFVNINYNGTLYQLGVNGQTGEVAGDLPYDEGIKTRKIVFSVIEQVLWTLLFGIPAFFVMRMFVTDAMTFDDPLFNVIAVFSVLVFLFVIGFNIFVYIKRLGESYFDDTKQLDNPPPLEFYITQTDENYSNLVKTRLNEESHFGTNIPKRVRPKYYMPSALVVGGLYLYKLLEVMPRNKRRWYSRED